MEWFRLWSQRGRVARMHDRFCASNAGCGGRKHVVAIVLAAGQSTRFCSGAAAGTTPMEPKQLALLDGVPVAQHSIALLAKHVDEVVIVTNRACYSAMCEIIRACRSGASATTARIYITVQDTASRLESIGCGIAFVRNYLAPDTDTRLLFHDAARPFITTATVASLLTKAETVPYVQCVLPLTNGLFCKTSNRSVDRDQHVELCTPMCVQYELCEFFFTHFMSAPTSTITELTHSWESAPHVGRTSVDGFTLSRPCGANELIDLFTWFRVPICFVYGQHDELRKITVARDLTRLCVATPLAGLGAQQGFTQTRRNGADGLDDAAMTKK